jgi:elongation factor P
MAGKYQTTDFRNGLKISIEGKPYIITYFQHVNPGKGSAFVKTKIKNLETGQVIARTFKAGVETVDTPDMEEKEMAFTYGDMDGFNFMDNETYDQIAIDKKMIDNSKFLKEGMTVEVLFEADKNLPLTVDLPANMIVEITYTEPGVKGDTATNAMKNATIETGAEIRVPLFINQGDFVKIDTTSGDYLERVKQ